MDDIFRIKSVSQLNGLINNSETQHPLVTIIDFSKVEAKGQGGQFTRFTSDLYSIMLKERCHGSLRYGRKHYDFQDGTLVFMAPEQIVGMDEEATHKDSLGWGLFFFTP